MNILEHPDASEAAVMGNFYLFLDQLIQNAAHPIIENSNKGMFRQHYVNLACQYVSTYYATIQSLDEIAVYPVRILHSVPGWLPQMASFLITTDYRELHSSERR